MGLNLKKLKKQAAEKKAERKTGGDFRDLLRRFKTDHRALFYVPAPYPEMEETPCIYVPQWEKVDPAKEWRKVFALGPDSEIWNDNIMESLEEWNALRKEKGWDIVEVDPDGGDPIAMLLDGELSPEDLGLPESIVSRYDKMKRKDYWYWALVPIAEAKYNAKEGAFEEMKRVPATEMLVHFTPATAKAHEQMIDAVDKMMRSRDMTDPLAPVFLEVTLIKDSKGYWEYTIQLDVDSITEAKPLPKSVRAHLKEDFKRGGEADFHKFLAGWINSPEQIVEMMGGETEKSSKGAATPADDKPACHGDPDQIESDDVGCQECAFKVSCAAKAGTDVPPDRAAKIKAKPAPEPEEEEVEEESEPEEEPKPKAKLSKFSSLKKIKEKEAEPEEEPAPKAASKKGDDTTQFQRMMKLRKKTQAVEIDDDDIPY